MRRVRADARNRDELAQLIYPCLVHYARLTAAEKVIGAECIDEPDGRAGQAGTASNVGIASDASATGGESTWTSF
jgi:hypothetical protein